MLTTSKRLILSLFVAVLGAAGLTAAAGPALGAGYSPTVVSNRSSAHHGGVVSVRLTHFAEGAKGTITAENNKTSKVISSFTTYQNGNKTISLTIPKGLPKGTYSFVVKVGHQYASFDFKVV